MQAILIEIIESFEFSPAPGNIEIMRGAAFLMTPMWAWIRLVGCRHCSHGFQDQRLECDTYRAAAYTHRGLRRGVYAESSGRYCSVCILI